MHDSYWCEGELHVLKGPNIENNSLGLGFFLRVNL